MPTKLYLRELSIEQIGFGYSVLYELMLSLYVLNDYKHHPLHITWALDTLKQMPDELRSENRFFRMIFSQIVNMIWQTDRVAEPSFERELDTFIQRPLSDFILPIIARLLHDSPLTGKRMWTEYPRFEDFQTSPDLQNQARTWLRTYFPDSVGLVDALLEDAEDLKARFVAMLQQYWDVVFRDQWALLEPLFQAEIMGRGQRLYHEGILSSLDGLNPRMRMDDEQCSITFISVSDGETLQFSDADRLSLQPSYFLYPSMIFYITTDETDENMALSITYPIPDIQKAGRSPLPPEDLLQILRGISDRTRLQILQLVATKPRSTSEIAQILNISDAAVSKHLKQMHQGGWVTSERSSYYVLYKAQDTSLDDLVQGLETLLKG